MSFRTASDSCATRSADYETNPRDAVPMHGRFMFRSPGAAEDFTRILIVMPVLMPKRACQEESQLQGISSHIDTYDQA